ncbi:hypothetical protein EON66_08635 [archaeon]|nr:MAG: hypothetical protein EON66_08635 [archaeon]
MKTSSRPVTGGRATTRRRGSLKPPTESALNDVLHVRLRDFSVRAPTTTGLLSGAGTAESEESSAAASLRRHDGSFYLPEDERELESATTKPSTAAERLSRRKGEDTAAAKAVRMARIVACYNAAVACIVRGLSHQSARGPAHVCALMHMRLPYSCSVHAVLGVCVCSHVLHWHGPRRLHQCCARTGTAL